MTTPTSNHHSHKDYLYAWLDILSVQQHSQNTIEAYHRDVQSFLQYCLEQQIQIQDVELSDLRQYLSFCVEQKNWSNQSMQRALSAIRQFMQWLQNQGVHDNAQIQDFKIKRQPRPLPGMISPENIQQLLDQPAPSAVNQQWLWARDKAMLELLYSSGLRLHELVELKLNDIAWSEQLIRVTGKGNKTRVIPFGQKAEQALKQWLTIRLQKPVDHHFVFISQNGQQISDRQVQNRVKQQAQRAGLSADLHPHLLRHCFASHMLSASGDLRAVQEMLGHSNLSTTQVYTHLDFEHLAMIYDQSHPRAKKT